MRPPWSIGFKMLANRHPGRRHIGARKGKAGVRGSVARRRRSASSRSSSHTRALNYHSNNRCRADSVRAMRPFPAGELSSLSTRWRRSSIVADSREITLRSDTVIKQIVERLRLRVPIPFLI